MNFSKLGIKRTLRQMKSKGVKIGNLFKVSFLQILFIGSITGCVLLGCIGLGAFNGILSSAPEIDEFDLIPTGYATVVYDSEGHEMTKLVASNSNRSYVTMDKIPQYLADSFVVIEDKRFYNHNGIDITGIIAAAAEGIKNRNFHRGASTITQQLIKNNVFTETWVNEGEGFAKYKRKIQEQYLALEVEKKMSKSQILEYYMNTINLGQSTLGVQAASQRYFGKPVYQLTISESAVIAGITKNPYKFNPITHPEDNSDRRDSILKALRDQGYITQDEFIEAMSDDVYSRIKKYNDVAVSQNVNSYFVDELTDQVSKDLVEIAGYDEDMAYKMLYSGGLKIYSTQNPEIQGYCDEVFANDEYFGGAPRYLLDYQLTIEHPDGSLENISKEMYKEWYKENVNKNFDLIFNTEEEALEAIENYKAAIMQDGDEERAENYVLTPQPQASITVMDQHTGYVLAMVGGRGQKLASKTLNRASDTVRQPGSLFKVLSTYAPALDACGFTLANVQDDAPFTYTNGRPISNWYGQAYRGICSLRTGIVQSLNIVTVKVLTQITPQMGYNYLQQFGFTTLVDREVTKDGQVMTDINQALALGGITHGVTNMETTAAFATIANEGVYNRPVLYSKITDSDGNIIIDNSVPDSHRVIREQTAFLLTSAMQDVVSYGTGHECQFPGMHIAGKTGTTSSYNDIWFSGYTPYYTATVWVGYDNNNDLPGNQHTLNKIIWKQCMSRIHSNLPDQEFDRPSGITTCAICSLSGKLPNPGLCDEHVRTEYFEEGTEPTETCDIHYRGTVCAYDGKIACDGCPFKTDGVAQLPLVEDPALDYGQQAELKDNHCCHNSQFFAQPNYQDIINQQMWEINSR